jgi:spore germination cell wall hydrolase CwlJ-like protein
MINELSDCLVVALTLLGEAGNEPYAGKIMVMETIWNRSQISGRTLREECLLKKQYSCWNNSESLWAKTADLGTMFSPEWKDCVDIAKEAIRTGWKSTSSATHYYAPKLLAKPPKWVKGMRLVAEVGEHKFYANKRRTK